MFCKQTQNEIMQSTLDTIRFAVSMNDTDTLMSFGLTLDGGESLLAQYNETLKKEGQIKTISDFDCVKSLSLFVNSEG